MLRTMWLFPDFDMLLDFDKLQGSLDTACWMPNIRLDVGGMHLQHRGLMCSVSLQRHAANSKAVCTPCVVTTLCSNVDLLLPIPDVICLLGLMQTTHGCGDLIFSSHTTFALVGVLTYTEYGAVVITKVNGLLHVCALNICCVTTHAACPTVLLRFSSSC